jgi:hypothetical protein
MKRGGGGSIRVNDVHPVLLKSAGRCPSWLTEVKHDIARRAGAVAGINPSPTMNAVLCRLCGRASPPRRFAANGSGRTDRELTGFSIAIDRVRTLWESNPGKYPGG